MKHCRGKPYRYDNGFGMMTRKSRNICVGATFNSVGYAAISADAGIGLVAGAAAVMATK